MERLDHQTLSALRRRGIDHYLIATLLGCAPGYAKSILDGKAEAEPRELAIIRLCSLAAMRGIHLVFGDLARGSEWRPIPDLEDYEVSRSGQIRRRASGHGARPGHLIKLRATRTGHLRFNYSTGSRKGTMQAHRAVAIAFIGPQPSPGHIVCHRNDVPTDNRAANLYWGTHYDNSSDRARNGLIKKIGSNLTQNASAGDFPDIRSIKKDYKKQMLTRLAKIKNRALHGPLGGEG